MHDFGHQTQHLILKYGYLFHKAARFAGLVQSKLPWRFIKDKRPSRSEILNEYLVHRQEGRGGEGALESDILAGDEARSRPDDPPARTGWKPTKKKKTTSQKLNPSATFLKGKVFTTSTSPLINSRAKYK
jgi:hypothetical protein